MDIHKNGSSSLETFGETFYKTTPSEFEDEIKAFALEKLHHIGVDGISVAISDRINEMTNEQFETWMEYHLKTCEDPNILGYSMHGLYFAKKL